MSHEQKVKQTGRTSRMLELAVQACHQRPVVVVLSGSPSIPHAVMLLRDLVPGAQYNAGARQFKLEGGGEIWLATKGNNLFDYRTMEFQGFAKDATFVDHDTLYSLFHRQIEEYLRYD